MSAIAFDLEIAWLPEPGQQPDPEDGLGISVAAGVTNTGVVHVWHGASFASRMSAAEVREMILDLSTYEKIITWNGAAFDFYVLGVEADDLNMARQLARGSQHIDLMMLFCATRRHRLGLKTAAAACGSHKGGGGIESGIDAPALWAQGECSRAIEYVTQDAQATWDVYRWMLDRGGFTWVSKKGYPMPYRPHLPIDKWSVSALLEEPWITQERWITAPVVKDDFVRW